MKPSATAYEAILCRCTAQAPPPPPAQPPPPTSVVDKALEAKPPRAPAPPRPRKGAPAAPDIATATTMTAAPAATGRVYEDESRHFANNSNINEELQRKNLGGSDGPNRCRLRENWDEPRSVPAAVARRWFIFAAKPPHVSTMAWGQLTQETRQEHIRWLRELKSCPADVAAAPLPTALLEMVRRMATARQWLWSTVSKALSSAKAALAYLPLYSRASRGIELGRDPEWRAAQRYARRMEARTAGNTGATPLTKEQYERVLIKLYNRQPVTALYLQMMWSGLARPEDIAGLEHPDVTIGPPTDEHRQVGLTIRHGKGAKRSGVFALPILLPAKYVSILQELLAVAKTGMQRQRLFDGASLKKQVLTALREEDQVLALASIRKGAARHLAAHGMSLQDLCRLLGHADTKTTSRYLGYGTVLPEDLRRLVRRTSPLLVSEHSSGTGSEMTVDAE